jgi:hypothetical protein
MLTYSVQKVGYAFEQLDPQGATDYPSFTQAFDAFPWAAQHAEWNDTRDGPHADGFQLNAVSMRMKKGLFGIGKGKLEQHVETIDVRKRTDVDTLCRLFCDRQYDELDRAVAQHVERNHFEDGSDD